METIITYFLGAIGLLGYFLFALLIIFLVFTSITAGILYNKMQRKDKQDKYKKTA